MTYKTLTKAFLATTFLCASSVSFADQHAATPAPEAKPVEAKQAKKPCPGCEVKALKHQVDALSKKLDDLQAKEAQEVKALKEELAKNTKEDKKRLLAGNDNVTLTLSGWVNRAMASYDSGYNKELTHVDNSGSSTRTTLMAKSTFNERYKAGFNFELEYVSANSKTTDIKTGDAAISINKRIIETYLDTWLGKLYLGQGPMTCNRIALNDLTGTNTIFDGIAFADITGGIRFATGRGALITSAANLATDRSLQVGSVYNEILGSKRYDRVSYITPSFAGFTLGVSHARRDRSDITLKYNGDLSGTKLLVSLGWFHDAMPSVNTFQANGVTTTAPTSTNPSGSSAQLRKVDQYGGSFAVLFPVGISLNVGYAAQRYKSMVGYEGRSNGSTWGGKLGFQRDFFNIGKTCLAVGYGESKKVMANAPYTGGTAAQRYAGDNSAKSKVWGVYATQNVDKLGSEIYLAYQVHKLSIKNGVGTTNGTNGQISVNNATTAAATTDLQCKKISVIMLGMRLKF